MYHLAPAARVGALADPAAPEFDGLLESLLSLFRREGAVDFFFGSDALENESRAFTFLENELGGDAAC